MNFHKTIGFLAALLLTLGLGVPDSFAQELESVTISINGQTDGTGAASIPDNVGTTVVTVSVTASYDADLDAGETKTVMVDVKAMGTTAEAADYASQPAFPLSITATAVVGNLATATGTATIILTPVADTDTDDEAVVLEATIGDQMAEAILTITDSEVGVTSVTLSLNGTPGDNSTVATPALTVDDDGGSTAVTVGVSVVFESALPTGETRTVMVSVDTDSSDAEAGDYSTTPSLPVSITVTGSDPPAATLTGSTSIAFTPQEDADYDDETVVLEATVENSDAIDAAILSITDVDISVTSVTLTLNGVSDGTGAASIPDDGGSAAVTVGVSVVFESALPTGETRTVMVDVKDMMGDNPPEPGDYSTIPSLPLSITLTGDGTNATLTESRSIALTPQEDADTDAESLVLEATVEDSDAKAEAILSITDADISASTVTLSLNGQPGDNSTVATPVVTLSGDNIGASIVTVGVSVLFSGTLDADVTRTVMVDVDTDSSTADPGDYIITPPLPVSITLTGDGSATTLTGSTNIVIVPARDTDDDNETVVFEATIGGADPDAAILQITDSMVDPDPVVGAVTGVAFSPATLSLTEGTAFTGTATVTVNVEAGLAQTVSVALTSDGPALADLGITSPVAVSVAAGDASGTADISVSYTPPEDDNFAGETITITGTAGTMSGDLTLNIADNDMGAGAVTSIEFSPDMLSLTEGTASTETVTVTVNVEAGVAQTVSVALTADGAALADLGITSPVAVPIAIDETSGTADISVSYTPPTDADVDDEMVTVTGTVGAMSSTLTLNVTDNTASSGTVEVSTSLESIRENSRTRDVVVTATLPAAPGAGNTVTVNVMVTGGTAPVPATITIAGTETSGTETVEITPVNDEVFSVRSITVTGGADGYKTGTAMIDVIDDDASLGTLSFSAISPPSATLQGGAQDLKLTVKIWLASPDTPIPNPLVVNVATDKGTLASSTVSITNIKKNVDFDPATRKADGSGTVVLSLTADDVDAAGEITVTASAPMYETGTRTIPVRARRALDVAGYRAVIAKPTGTAWVNIGNDKIFVDVTRHGNVAYPWGDFESIKVSVRDTAHADFELETVTASGFNREDNGAVTFEEPGSTSRGDVIWRGNDTIRFEIRIRAHSAYSEDDRAANGQYLGAYAHVEFTSGGEEPASIETRDDETSVYSADPALVDDAKVGDGRLIRIDNLVPAHSGVDAVRVTSGDEVGSAIEATVGDEIRVAVAVSETNLFRESGLRIQMQIVDGKGSVRGQVLTAAQRNAPSKNKDFSTSEVISAASSSDSLIHTYTVTEGFFTVKLDDFVEGVGAKGASLDLNNAQARVRAGVKDQAANFKFSGWTTFNIDSRSPGVSILYPSADPDSIYDHTHSMHFSGADESIVEGQNVDAHLNPLRISFDEELSKLEVYAAGADTLSTEEASNSRRYLRYHSFAGGATGELDSVIVNTSNLSSPKKDGVGEDDEHPGDYVPSSANRAGTEIELVVLATDDLGNTTKTTISGVTHDASPPVITDWFPTNSLLPEDKINDATPPIFTLPEDVDSIAVTFEGSNGSDVTKERGGVSKEGEDSIDFSGALTDGISYDMMIFVRDLAGNVFITPADSSSNITFEAGFDNPVANTFTFSTETDSVIAGQANILEIQAEDHDAGSDTERNALTYKNAARISAWDASGGAAESVWFEGTGVTDDADSPDGVAMLSAADWRIGKRDVTVKSNKATGFIKILVQHLDSGEGDTAVIGFDSAKDSLYVGAADFAGFDITAWEEGVEGEAPEIWGDYTLRVVPVDRHGNPSVRAFNDDPDSALDSLAVLDTRVGKDIEDAVGTFEYKDGIDVEIVGVPAIEDFALLILSIEKEGATYDLVAPDDRRSQTVQVRVVNGSLDDNDDRSQNVRSSAKFKISAPLEPVLTLWVPGSDVDEAGNDVVIPADPGDVTVTVAAAGFNAGDMVTFTRNGTAGDPVAADDDGVARLMITASVASTTTVSASNGVYSTDELTITFVDTPAVATRKSFASSDGMPVYLVYSGDAPPDMTVGLDDFGAFGAAFGSSEGDENYNLQADIDGDGDVDLDDFGAFISSYGRTADGPATKPLVLLPGINENAEFSLSLGSERVVAGELVAVDVSLANVAALVSYGFALNYETDKFEFVSVAPADEDLLKSTGGETPLFYHVVADGQVEVANSIVNGTAVSGGGDIVRFVFRVLREFEDNARFEIANGLVFDPSQLQNPAVVAGVLELQSTPREFALHQNFPNPFNPDTTIKYDLAESADVTLQIYNVLGQVVRTLVASEAQNAGRYQIRWNGMDDRGVSVSSGIYFYQISADGKFSDVRKLMLLK